MELLITQNKNTIDIITKLDIYIHNKVYYQRILYVLMCLF